jgi:hypothetical protein
MDVSKFQVKPIFLVKIYLTKKICSVETIKLPDSVKQTNEMHKNHTIKFRKKKSSILYKKI